MSLFDIITTTFFGGLPVPSRGVPEGSRRISAGCRRLSEGCLICIIIQTHYHITWAKYCSLIGSWPKYCSLIGYGPYERPILPPSVPYSSLNDRDRRTVAYVRKHVTGLPFYPGPKERALGAHSQSQVKDDIVAIWRKCQTPLAWTVAYKGSRVFIDCSY